MSYRNDLDALTARRDALSIQVEQSTRELEDTEHLLAEAKRRARLPVLDNIRVASPCKADWAKMTGDERTRHCGDCKKDVFNISNLTRAEAEALITSKNGDLCVRYFQRHDGTILLADCEVGAKKKRRKLKIVAAGAAALLASGVAGAMLMRGGKKHHGDYVQGGAEPAEPMEEVVMGKMMAEPPPRLEEAPQIQHEPTKLEAAGGVTGRGNR